MRKGITLIEVMMTIVMLAVLVGITMYVFRITFSTWSSQEVRAGIDIPLNRAIEEVARDLRGAKDIKSNNDEIRFTDISDNDFIFYFYNASDTYPPQFNQPSYELRKAALTPDIDGALADSGRIIITDVVPPPTSDLSEDPNISDIFIIDLTITRGDETIRSRTKVRPRNL